jgi:putative transposase
VVRQVRAGLRQSAAPAAPAPGDKWHLDEVFVGINGRLRYLWRAVDKHGNVLDVLVQSRRNAVAAKRFFRKLLKGLR